MKRRAVRAIADGFPVDGVLVGSVKMDARSLITIGPEHELWTNGSFLISTEFQNAIVRVRPPATATDEQLESLSRLLGGRAAKVRFESRAQANMPAPVEDRTHETIRETVMAMTENSQRRDELVALLDEKLSKVKL